MSESLLSRRFFWAFWAVATLVIVAYAAGMVEYGLAIWNSRLPAALDLMALAMSPDVINGTNGHPDFVTPLYALFDRNKQAMTLHILAGSLVLVLGTSQFLPAARRWNPRIHRMVGIIVIVGMLACVTGAMWRLSVEPPANTYSGPGFHAVLWYLAVASGGSTILAVISLFRGEFRQHMLWMALGWSAFLTAPSLRINTTVMYWLYGGVHEHLNFSAGAGAWVETSLMMLLWLHFVGDRDLPARRVEGTSWPRWVLAAIAGTAAALSLHEGVLAPIGLDLAATVRGDLGVLPVFAAPWGLASAATAWGALTAFEDGIAGRRPPVWWTGSVFATAVGAALVAATTPTVGQLAQPVNAVFGVSALVLPVLAGASLYAATNPLGRRAWTITLAFFTWSPAGLVIGALLAPVFGLTVDETYTTGLILGPTTFCLLGIATSAGVKLPLPAVATRTIGGVYA